MAAPTTGSLGIILDSSILVAFERRRFDLERFLTNQASPAIAAITAAELLIGVERADTPERRSDESRSSKASMTVYPLFRSK